MKLAQILLIATIVITAYLEMSLQQNHSYNAVYKTMQQKQVDYYVSSTYLDILKSNFIDKHKKTYLCTTLLSIKVH